MPQPSRIWVEQQFGYKLVDEHGQDLGAVDLDTKRNIWRSWAYNEQGKLELLKVDFRSLAQAEREVEKFVKQIEPHLPECPCADCIMRRYEDRPKLCLSQEWDWMPATEQEETELAGIFAKML